MGVGELNKPVDACRVRPKSRQGGQVGGKDQVQRDLRTGRGGHVGFELAVRGRVGGSLAGGAGGVNGFGRAAGIDLVLDSTRCEATGLFQ